MAFDVPDRVERAFLVFGGHRIPLALRGMTGSQPSYDYRLHYSEIRTGSDLYDVGGKRITLESLEQHRVSGAIDLQFSATNNSEASDFTPLVEAVTARVSGAGEILDDLGDVDAGWTPVTFVSQGDALAPGQTGSFVLRLPRVAAGDFPLPEIWDQAPDAVLLQLAATDAVTASDLRTGLPAFALFDSSSRERRFWLPDLAIRNIRWQPVVPAVGRNALITVTVENQDAYVGAGESNLVFRVDGEILGGSRLDAIGPGEAVDVSFTWEAHGDAETFGATIDPDDEVEEDSEANNQSVVSFGGAAFPDLAIRSLAWSPRFPTIGDRVTFTVTVNNQGRGIAGAFRVYVYFDGSQDPRWNLPFPEMTAGQTATGTFSWTALDEFHYVQAVADGGRQVAEADESNNSATAGPTAVEGLPDPTVTGINWTPDLPIVGQNVTVTVSVKNRHPLIGANASVLLFQVDAEDFGEVSVGALSPGDSASRSFTWKAEEGQHTFGAIVDHEDDIEETDEDNNARRVTFGGSAFPDLVITALTWSPNRPSVDDTVRFSVMVVNQGRVSAGGFRAYVYFDDDTIPRWDLAFPSLSAGRGVTRTFSWTA